MVRPSKYSVELKSRAVRMVTESRSDYPSEFEAIRSIAMKLGIGSPESLRKWIRQGEIDDGVKLGKTREDIAEIRELKKEVAELRRANSILKSASAYVGDRCQEAVSSSRWRSPSKTFCRPIWPLLEASSRWRSRVGRNSMVVTKKVQDSQIDSKWQSSSTGRAQ